MPYNSAGQVWRGLYCVPRPGCKIILYAAGQVDDWELVNREAHHRIKSTLMLLAASVRRDFKREKAI